MPVDFVEACEMFGVDPQKALQYFLDHLSICAHISKRCDNPKSVATAIFDSYLERRGYNPEPDFAKKRDKYPICQQGYTPDTSKIFSGGERNIL